MTEYIFLIIGVFFFGLSVGLIIGETLSEINRKRAEINIREKKNVPEESLRRTDDNVSPPFDKEGKDPMMLRNGFGVTRDRNPTFAEQWVNIMNYSGESQTEGDYEETGDYPEDDLG